MCKFAFVQIAADEGNADAQETEEEKNTRIAAMKQKKLAMMRHAVILSHSTAEHLFV